MTYDNENRYNPEQGEAKKPATQAEQAAASIIYDEEGFPVKNNRNTTTVEIFATGTNTAEKFQ